MLTLLPNQGEEQAMDEVDITEVVTLMRRTGALDPAPVVTKTCWRSHIEMKCALVTTLHDQHLMIYPSLIG